MIIKYYIDPTITDAELVEIANKVVVEDKNELEFYITYEELDKVEFLRGQKPETLYGHKLNII